MYEGFLSYGGTEIANHARTLAYSRSVMGGDIWLSERCVCDAIHLPSTYNTPAADAAPWYDATRPETAGFAGLWVEQIVGIDDPFDRVSATTAPGGGGRLGRRRRQARTVTVSGVALGANRAAVNAGLEWLARVCSGDAATTTYLGLADLGFYAACPPAGQVAADYSRTLSRVLLSDGPSVGSWLPGDGGPTGVEVRLQFIAEVPEIHWPATAVGGTLTPTGKHPAEYFCCHDLTTLPGITLPPPAGAPAWRPFREPWWTQRASVTIAHNKPWDADVGFTLNAGGSELRNARITLFRLASGQTCPAAPPADTAIVCGQAESVIEVPYLPAGGVLVVDSARRLVQLTHNGATVDGRRYLTSSQNGPLRYPVIPARAHSACLAVATDHAYQSGATVTAITTQRRSLTVG